MAEIVATNIRKKSPSEKKKYGKRSKDGRERAEKNAMTEIVDINILEKSSS